MTEFRLDGLPRCTSASSIKVPTLFFSSSRLGVFSTRASGAIPKFIHLPAVLFFLTLIIPFLPKLQFAWPLELKFKIFSWQNFMKKICVWNFQTFEFYCMKQISVGKKFFFFSDMWLPSEINIPTKETRRFDSDFSNKLILNAYSRGINFQLQSKSNKADLKRKKSSHTWNHQWDIQSI